MKIARFKQEEDSKYKDDIEKLKDIFASFQILIPESDIVSAWKTYSRTKDEEWSAIPEKDDETYLAIIDYLHVEEW